MSAAGSTAEISYSQPVDVPPHPEQQAPPTPAVPAQRSGDDPAVPPIGSAPTHRRPRNWRLLIAVVAGVLSTLCAGGSLTAYLVYNKATAPNRGSPAIVVLQYLNAYLGSRDSARAALFACEDNPDLPAVKAARDDLVSRERQFHVSIDVAVDGVQEASRSDDRAQVAASISLTTVVNGSSQRVVEQWVFQTESHGGWRVCDGREVT
jgi:hypothetical protein